MKPFLRDSRCSHVPSHVQALVNRVAKDLFQAQVEAPTLTITLPLSHAPQGLLDVLCDGVAYGIKDDKIYIWYSKEDQQNEAGYYRLVRFEYTGTPVFRKNLKKFVKFTLSQNEKL